MRNTLWVAFALTMTLAAGCATTDEPQQRATASPQCDKAPPVTGSNIPRRDPCATGKPAGGS